VSIQQVLLQGDPLTEQESGQGQPWDSGRAAYRPEQSAADPVPGGAGYPPPSAPPRQQSATATKGFLSALFDFGFTSFVTPKVVKVLYPLIMIFAALGALGFVAAAFSANTVFGILALFILAPLFFLVTTAIYRILLEFFIVIFRVAEDIRALRERGDLR
jgi:Domain of unknown function (DUF4282)